MKNFEICKTPVEKGKKKFLSLTIAQRSVSEIKIPVTVINGTEDGPLLGIVAGEHGCEYPGILTAAKLSREISPKKLSGGVVILPIVNIPSFENRSMWVNPIDQDRLWDKYPGKLDGTMSQIMVYNVFNEIILKCDYVLQLHSGDLNEALYPHVIFRKTGKQKTDQIINDLVSLFDVQYALEYHEPEGNGTLMVEASKRDIPTIVLEAGQKGLLEENDVNLFYNGIINVMKYLKMINGKPKFYKPTILKGAVDILSKHGGILYSHVKLGSIVKKGDLLGEIWNVRGEVLEQLRAPIDGVALAHVTWAAVDPGSLPQQYTHYLYELGKL
jgi:hypothetical protein